jgi:hypothetical protein
VSRVKTRDARSSIKTVIVIKKGKMERRKDGMWLCLRMYDLDTMANSSVLYDDV